MRAGVRNCAQCDQVRCGVISQTTPKVLVVNFQVRHCAARMNPQNTSGYSQNPSRIAKSLRLERI
jgi:hypothetical protein